MIVAIGTDIVDHKMAVKLNWKEKPDLLKRIFTEHELRIFYDSKSIQFLYGRFAAKEAILKCLGTGMVDGLAMIDIQVTRGHEGQPIVDLVGMASEIAAGKKITKWQISISHSESCSMAFVIAESIIT